MRNKKMLIAGLITVVMGISIVGCGMMAIHQRDGVNRAGNRNGNGNGGGI